MIYLHIGTSKTGTTTLQRSLLDNREPLLTKQILYPRSTIHLWGHHNLYYELAKNKLYNPALGNFKDLIQELKEFKNKCPDGDVVISSETFCGALPDELKYMFDEFSQIDKVNVVVYYRRQDRYLRSFWSMPLGRDNIREQLKEELFEKWATECIEKNRYSLFYNRQVNKFEKLIGRENIKLLVYDDVPRQIFFQVFLNTIGLDDFDGINLPKRDFNPSTKKIVTDNLKIKEVCQERFQQSNLILGRKYLHRDYLFDYDVVPV